MKNRPSDTSPLTAARMAGFLYLLVVPLGIFSLYIASLLIVPGDAVTTAANLKASEWLFRLSLVSDMLAPVILIIVVLCLYWLFRPVNKFAAQLMVWFLMAGVPIALLNKVNQFGALQLISGADYLTALTPEQLQTLMFYSLRLAGRGSDIAFIFWGLWLLPLGYLVLKSGFMPKILGLLLMISCFGYLIENFAGFLGYNVSIGLYTAWGEVLFILWLLLKGVNVERWKQRALEAT